jgi:hypothetical protein
MHQQAIKRHQTGTAIFERIKKPFYCIKISHKHIISASSNINNNSKQDLKTITTNILSTN